jgi:hypothetical protein
MACVTQTGLWPVSQQVSMLTFQQQNQKLTVNLLMDHYNISPKQGTWEIIIYIGSYFFTVFKIIDHYDILPTQSV